MYWTLLKMSTDFSDLMRAISTMIAMKVPVRPTPALKEEREIYMTYVWVYKMNQEKIGVGFTMQSVLIVIQTRASRILYYIDTTKCLLATNS